MRAFRHQKVEEIHENCQKCGLYKTCVSPFMSYTGNGGDQCLIIAEAPGRIEDERGEQLIGQAGQFLRKKLGVLGKDLDKDFWKTNALICRPPKNATPTTRQLSLCRRNLMGTVTELNPRFIWLLGATSIGAYFGGRKTDIGINKLRGTCIPDPQNNCYVFPMFHPSFLLRQKHDRNLDAIYKSDMKNALKKMEELAHSRPKELDIVSPVRVTKDPMILVAFFSKLKKEKPITAFDFETSELKPYDDKQFIWSMSVSTDTQSLAFPIHYPKGNRLPESVDDLLLTQNEYDLTMDLVEDYLTDPTLKKVCHNKKFEGVWSRCVIGVEPKGIIWCTMNNQHLIDTRRGICGLKHQAFVRWGITGYEDDMAAYMRPLSGNKGNMLHTAPLDKLLTYNGQDSFLTMKLFREEQEVFRSNRSLNSCRAFYHEGNDALEDVQMDGVCVDGDYFNTQWDELGDKLKDIASDIHNHRDVKKFEAQEGKELNINSSVQLRKFFFKFLGLKATKMTAKEVASVDASVMDDLLHPVSDMIVNFRKTAKIKDTYLSQFRREVQEDGKIHPFFDLHTVSTGRSSSSRPNFQNIPVRDEVAKKVIRSGIIPRPGHLILEVDYSSLEVRIIACYTQDGTLVSYIKDKTTDMHRDEAKNIFFLPENEVTGVIRFYAKNGWVFPEFYGSYWKSCGNELWHNVVMPNLQTASGIPIQDHLKAKGIRTLDGFHDHLKAYEEIFWGRYPQVKEWQEQQFRFYQRNCFTKTFFGYQQRDYLSNNNLVNGPIQGTAFHCLLWSLIEINKIRKAEKWNTKIMGQIHDSILFDVEPSELIHVHSVVDDIMCHKIREKFPWIIVPMEIECEKTDVDQPWSTKKEWTP